MLCCVLVSSVPPWLLRSSSFTPWFLLQGSVQFFRCQGHTPATVSPIHMESGSCWGPHCKLATMLNTILDFNLCTAAPLEALLCPFCRWESCNLPMVTVAQSRDQIQQPILSLYFLGSEPCAFVGNANCFCLEDVLSVFDPFPSAAKTLGAGGPSEKSRATQSPDSSAERRKLFKGLTANACHLCLVGFLAIHFPRFPGYSSAGSILAASGSQYTFQFSVNFTL